MIESPPLPGFTVPVVPVARQTLAGRQHAAIGAGIPPLIHTAIDHAHTCGGCGNLITQIRGGTYFKCALVPDTHGQRTDIRKSWPACTKWIPR